MYYTLEKASEILSMTPGDLNRLREAGKIRAFRDGSDWKFRKEDIDNYLAKQIKSRSKATLGSNGESDLLNETEEELPTMLADSTSFESLVGSTPEPVKINANIGKGDDVVLERTEDASSSNALDSDDDLRSDGGSSGISLIDDDQIRAGASGSGIALLDDGFFDMGGSNVDLEQGDIILGDASSSGLNLSSGSGITLGMLSSGASGSGISLLSDDDNLFSLAPETIPEVKSDAQPTPPQKTAQPKISLQKSEEPEIFSLAENTSAPAETKPSEPAEEEDFQLAPIATGSEDSDSESSSQVIPLEDENLFTEDKPADDGGAVYGLADEPKTAPEPKAALEPEAAAPADDFASVGDLDLGLNDDLGDLGGDFGSVGGALDTSAGALDGMDDMGGGFGDLGDMPPASPNDTANPPDFAAKSDDFSSFPAASGADVSVDAATLPINGGCSYAAGKGCMQEPNYSGLAIALGLVPCLLVLTLAGICAYELVRTIWSWDEPFGLTGTILETIGGLISLI